MVSTVLQITNSDKRTLEVFINSNNDVFIGDVTDAGDMCADWITISYEDWKVVKKFIDKQFKETL